MSDDQAAALPGVSGVAGAPGIPGPASPGDVGVMPEPSRHAPDRNLAMELARVTEAGDRKSVV